MDKDFIMMTAQLHSAPSLLPCCTDLHTDGTATAQA